MKKTFKRLISTVLLLALTLSFNITAFANPSIGNGLILSDDVITLSEGSSAILTAAMQEGFDASRLTCVSADPNIATATPIAAVSNVANFQINYVSNGSTVIAIVHMDNPAVVAYTVVNASTIMMNVPPRLGTNHDNYCVLTGYEFTPYNFNKYKDFGVYKYTLKLTYQIASFKDDDYTSWGCYGYFYDATGNVLSQVHLYGGSLSAAQTPPSVGQIYTSEFNVPANAVRFSIEGF